MPFRLTEPHPSVSTTSYIHSGRGGAGNYKHIDPRTLTPPSTATGPASLAPLPSNSTRTFKSGRGGAGNTHQGSERAIFSFDEELERQRMSDGRAGNAPIFHVGRGGAGNLIVDERRPSQSGRQGSADSSMSRDSGLSDRARRSLDWFRDSMSRTR
ncbi:hypothetical protein MMC08_008123 [Hypocenomyce scalaris]|nr:hypothetical protein [Hypocenomyce scalaris]